jgi:hypothetical protein
MGDEDIRYKIEFSAKADLKPEAVEKKLEAMMQGMDVFDVKVEKEKAWGLF